MRQIADVARASTFQKQRRCNRHQRVANEEFGARPDAVPIVDRDVESLLPEVGGKSAQLSQALKNGKRVIVYTIQTSPFALLARRKSGA